MDDIGRILPGLFRKQIRRAEPRLVEILLALWPRIAGRAMAQHSSPVSFANGALTVSTDCPTWGAQLRHMTEELRAGINGFLGQPIVRKLRIKIEPPALFLPPTVRQSAAPSPVFREHANTAAIADGEIAAAFSASYAKYFSRHRA